MQIDGEAVLSISLAGHGQLVKMFTTLEPRSVFSLDFAYLYILRVVFGISNKLTVMFTTHGERRLFSIGCPKKCFESKLDGQTDSNSDYSAYLRVVHKLVKLQHAILHIITQPSIYGVIVYFLLCHESLNYSTGQ